MNTLDVVTHGGVPRAYKRCLCHKCGLVTTCTPSFDFYTTDEQSGPLLCAICFDKYAAKRIKEE